MEFLPPSGVSVGCSHLKGAEDRQTSRKGEMHSSDLYLDNRISGSVYKTQNAAEASTTSLERPV